MATNLDSWRCWVYDRVGHPRDTKLLWDVGGHIPPYDNARDRRQEPIFHKKGVYYLPYVPGVWKPVYHILEQMCHHDWQR